jgi:AraC-like DNA-binding protein
VSKIGRLALSAECREIASMKLRPICEPVDLPLGAAVVAERVDSPDDAPVTERLLHFHDVCELVLFDRVAGTFFAQGRQYPLQEGSIIFVPSMHHHDFELAAGSKAWTLVQIDPYVVERLALQPVLTRLTQAFCVQPTQAARRRIGMLAEWLIEANTHDVGEATIIRIVELLLVAVAAEPDVAAPVDKLNVAHVERLLPALEQLRLAPDRPATLVEAAGRCHLSSAYFSRRFSELFGMNFTDYSRVYRLHLAARRLVTTGAAVGDIAYALGFASPSHFTARFHERFGVTPGVYRRTAQHRQKASGTSR